MEIKRDSLNIQIIIRVLFLSRNGEMYWFVLTFTVFNATFKNISVILWRSVLLLLDTRAPRENHRPAASHRQTLSHNVVSSTTHNEQDSMICTDYTCSCKSNHHIITTTISPVRCTLNYLLQYTHFLERDESQIRNQMIDFLCLTSLSAIFKLYHGDQF